MKNWTMTILFIIIAAMLQEITVKADVVAPLNSPDTPITAMKSDSGRIQAELDKTGEVILEDGGAYHGICGM